MSILRIAGLHRHTPRAGLAFALALGAAFVVSSCSSGGEDAPCSGGMVDCGECTDVSTSLRHCGSCGTVCGSGQDCVSGVCQCMGGLSACGSACVNLTADPDHCGGCGRACPTGTVCSMGDCRASCGAGLLQCGASCIDIRTSVTNCGQCGRSCGAGQTCTDGTCVCAQGRVECGDGCIDLGQDPKHCGRCNNECSAGALCNNGVCQAGAGGAAGNGGVNVAGAGATSSAGATSGGNGGVSAAGGGATSGGGAPSGGSSARGGGPSGAGTSAAGAGGSTSGCQATGFHVRDGTVYDVNCEEFVMRGVNYPYAWYSTRNTAMDFAAIAATGANTVRIVLSNGGFMNGSERWPRTEAQALSTLLQAAKAAKLVAMVEVHDTTGYSEKMGAVPLSSATSYWTDPAIAPLLKGQEAFVLINIGNEPNGNDTTSSWVSSHVTAIQTLRTAGFDHTLVVDGPNWAQDWMNTMRDGGGAPIWDADAKKNLIFSVHMYDVYSAAATVTNYFNTFLSKYSAPLIVGEFAADHGASGNVDEATIMANAEMLSVGYLGWSWAGNSSDLSSLDITNNFNASSLTTWGTRLITGANGIQMTSKRCTCFD